MYQHLSSHQSYMIMLCLSSIISMLYQQLLFHNKHHNTLNVKKERYLQARFQSNQEALFQERALYIPYKLCICIYIYIYMIFRTELGPLDLVKDIYWCKQSKEKEKYVCNTQDFMLGNSKPLVKCSQTLVNARQFPLTFALIMSFPIINNPPIIKLSLQKSLLLMQSTDAIVKLRDDGNYLREKVKVTCKNNYRKICNIICLNLM